MANPSRKKRGQRRKRSETLESALISLDRSRGPLFREIDRIAADKRGPRSEEPHLHCTRKFNRMRITDLEAIDIARAFHEKPHLKGKLPEVYARIAQSIEHLRDTEDPQAYTCPLLDGKKCMVHRAAKPIACLAWNPGRDYSTDGWHSFHRRDKLNVELFGDEWQLKAIPLQLTRFLEEADRLVAGPSGSTLRKKAMARGEIGPRARSEAEEAAPERPKARRGAARHGPGRDGGAPSAADRRMSRTSRVRHEETPGGRRGGRRRSGQSDPRSGPGGGQGDPRGGGPRGRGRRGS